MRIAFYEVEAWQKELLGRKLKGHELLFFSQPLRAKTAIWARECDAVSVFVDSRVDKKTIKRLPKVRLITTRSTGFDHIDVKYAAEKGVGVCNVPAYGEHTVAEFVFTLILGLTRKLCLADQATRTHQYLHYESVLRGSDLSGKTIGIIGGGRIGLSVAKIAKGFNMKVLVYDIKRNPTLATEIGFTYTSLAVLLSKSDIVSVNCFYAPSTHHLLNAQAFSKMKPSAIVINTARGEIIDTKALVHALGRRQIAGAGLDVIEHEIEVRHKIHHRDLKQLLRMTNVIITPHIAYNTNEAVGKILEVTIENITNFKIGKPTNVVSS